MMKSFKKYLREHGVDLDSNFHGGSIGLGGSDGKKDPESLLNIVRFAMESHYDDVMTFVQELGKKDPRVQDKLDELTRTALNDPKPFGEKARSKEGLGHEVVPNTSDRADGGAGLEQD